MEILASIAVALIWITIEAAKKLAPEIERQRLALALATLITLALAIRGEIPLTEAGITGFISLVGARLFHDAVQNPILGKVKAVEK